MPFSCYIRHSLFFRVTWNSKKSTKNAKGTRSKRGGPRGRAGPSKRRGRYGEVHWDAPWRAGPDRIMPGTAAGSAPQEIC